MHIINLVWSVWHTNQFFVGVGGGGFRVNYMGIVLRKLFDHKNTSYEEESTVIHSLFQSLTAGIMKIFEQETAWLLPVNCPSLAELGMAFDSFEVAKSKKATNYTCGYREAVYAWNAIPPFAWCIYLIFRKWLWKQKSRWAYLMIISVISP